MNGPERVERPRLQHSVQLRCLFLLHLESPVPSFKFVLEGESNDEVLAKECLSSLLLEFLEEFYGVIPRKQIQ